MYSTFKNRFIKRAAAVIVSAAMAAGVFPFSAVGVLGPAVLPVLAADGDAFNITTEDGSYTYSDNILTINSGGGLHHMYGGRCNINGKRQDCNRFSR